MPNKGDDHERVGAEAAAEPKGKPDAYVVDVQKEHSRPLLAQGIGRLLLVGAVLMGVLIGVGAFTFGYGEGWAYLSKDPAACANCHIMQAHFDSWQKSSHHTVAGCNDCHLPHDFLGKWVTKADNGFFHSLAFTTGNFPEPLRIKPRNRRVTQGACLHCHADFVHAVLPATPEEESLLCVHCHTDVGHGLR
jgi:cytochrome c nitrite reductase small subunit